MCVPCLCEIVLERNGLSNLSCIHSTPHIGPSLGRLDRFVRNRAPPSWGIRALVFKKKKHIDTKQSFRAALIFKFREDGGRLR
jgi:hypothetical protein